VAAAASPGLAHALVFVVFAGILVAAVPLIVTMPDHRGSW
jgi:hypothetical protein